MDSENPVTLLGINSVFLVTAALLITLGYFLQVQNLYMGLIITELFIIPVSAIVYLKLKGADAKEAFRLKGIGASVLWKCALITLCVYPVGLFLNLLANMAIGMLGELLPVPVPAAESGREYIINILVIALTAALGEELFFRGFILTGYERLGERKAIIISAVFFGIFHFNIQNFIGPVFLGVVFGYMAIRTGSLAAPVVGHFINNAVSVTFMYIAETVSDTPVQGLENAADAGIMAAGLIFWGVLSLAGGAGAIRLFRGLGVGESYPGMAFSRPSFTDFIPVAITVIVFLVVCISQLMFIIGSAG